MVSLYYILLLLSLLALHSGYFQISWSQIMLIALVLLPYVYVDGDESGRMYCYGNNGFAMDNKEIVEKICINDTCDYTKERLVQSGWSEWGHCSSLDSAGYKWRCRCDSCNIDNHNSFDEEYFDCCGQCNHGDYKQSSDRCQCDDEYHDQCCESECSVPKYCIPTIGRGAYWCDDCDENEHCKPPSSCCKKCQNTTTTYKAYHLNPEDHQCKPRCNWLDHFCWPGTCDESNNYLATTCKCQPGFKLQSSEEKSECLLTHVPDIDTCRIGAESPYGEAANSTFSNESTACWSTEDAHTNFEIMRMFFEFSFRFELPEDPPSEEERHDFVEGFNFGIIDALDTVNLYRTTGEKTFITEIDLGSAGAVNCSIQNFSREYPWAGMITCHLDMEYDIPDMLDGEKVCHHFQAMASGFVLIQDMAIPEQPPERHEYDVITTSREVCFHTDYTSPDHCLSIDENCEKDVLNFGHRIRRTNEITISFDGWFDPEPASSVSYASGIKGYEIEIRDVHYTPVELFADFMSIATYEVSNNENLEIFLPNRSQPSMYAIYLWALDSTQEGPNYRIARRFVLVDNTSEVVTNASFPMVITSASEDTDYEWQTVLNYIKVDWKHHFHNSWHMHTNLLLPIRPEKNLTITDHFEQETGELPVSGTPNIDGIVNFQYKFQRISSHGEVNQQFKTAPEEALEKLTLTEFHPEDGDLVHITIKAVDIMNNTFDDNITAKVDSSHPLIEDMYLVKDGYRQVFVHDSTDLSEMDMTFRSYDPHSGLKSVFWKLGTRSGMSNIGTGALPVVKEQNNVSCSDYCYCPLIGPCEAYNYSVPLAGLIANNTHIGDHNREYHFTFTTINEANLLTTDKVVILVDTSPPEPGHVFDGEPGEKDRDFQSEPFLSWYWTGFIDHESGISKYHAAVGLSCFSKDELQFLHEQDNNNLTDLVYFTSTHDTSINVLVNETGKYHVSVIAFNGALEPSIEVCSSGLTFDTTSPVLKNISLIGSVHQKKVVCSENDTWLLSDTGVLQSLYPVHECIEKCINISVDFDKFPKVSLQNGTDAPPLDIETSILVCNTFDIYIPGEPMFLKTDTFHLTWEILEEESQMLDYFVGIASNELALEEPDITGFVSTHNSTDHKCIHCGIGQGESVYVALKAINKALLWEQVAIGPIIIDMTPPVYRGGLKVIMGNDDVILIWEFDSFIDMDYDTVLTEYEWSIGSHSNKEAVVKWTKHIFPDDIMTNNNLFTVKYPKQLLQAFDQDHGWTYHFFIKCFNKALLYTEEESEAFNVHTKIMPSAGIVEHMDITNYTKRGIGFQESTSELCIEWTGFSHNQNNMKILVSIGSFPYWSDIEPLTGVGNVSMHCFQNLSLELNKTYYAMVVASNRQGIINSTSKGIFIAKATQVIKHACINLGERCPVQYDYILKDTPSLENSIKFNKIVPISSSIYWTIHVEIETTDVSVRKIIILNYRGTTHTAGSWSMDGERLSLFFSLIQADDSIVFNIVLLKPLIVSKVTMHQCLKTSGVQAIGKVLYTTWVLERHFANQIDDYRVELYQGQVMTTSTDDSLRSYRSGKDNKLLLPYTYEQNQMYTLCVRPCFQNTCITASVCSNFTVDREPPVFSDITAFLNSHQDSKWRDANTFSLTAEWSLFIESGTKDTVLVYDWTISSERDGSGLLLKWQRLFLGTYLEDHYMLKENVTLHAYKYKTMYFTLRTVSSAGVPILVSTLIRLRDLQPPSGVTVFDLPPTYNLDPLKDFLHSSNLGPLSKELHNSDVDYLSDPNTISGAISGCNCGEYTWTIQADDNTYCIDKNLDECIATKRTKENIVTFRRQQFVYGMQYIICVHSGGTCTSFMKCSNGFIHDNVPPLAGKAYMGDNMQEASLVEANVFITWESFTDVEIVTNNSDVKGIRTYFTSIGTFPDEEDIVAFTSTGDSDHVYFNNIPFVPGKSYQATVKACDNVGLCTSVSSSALLFDDTPPVIDYVSLHLLSQWIQDNNTLIARWSTPQDNESGIRSIAVALGTTEFSSDISGYRIAQQNEIIFDNTCILDGQKYFAHIKVTNKVGLWNIKASNHIWYDSTPPESGYVRHGSLGENYSYSKNDKTMTFHWGGFSDPHSGIFMYRVAIGSEPYTTDKQHWKFVGLKSEITLDMNLEHGQSYFALVECCNGAMLCTKVVSKELIVDVSRPIPGVIHVGETEEHENYQYNRNSILIKWAGFIDMESDIQLFQWCISTINSSCDVVQLTNAYKENQIRPHNLSLPLHTSLFVTLTAYNYVGMSIQSKSKEFLIDHTPPYVIQRPTLVTPSSLRQKTQYDGSYISLSWNITDDEIPMKSFELSIQSHHDGIVPVSNLMLGIASGTTIALPNDQRLRDGNIYSVKVIGCNAAGVCCASSSDDFIVDSTPPLLGGFLEPMYWRIEKDNTVLSLLWTGFVDPHSDVRRYFLMIGSSYGGSDISDGIKEVEHDKSNSEQRHEMVLRGKTLPIGNLIYLTIWAENGVGLSTVSGKLSVFVLPEGKTEGSKKGELLIQKHSCDIQYCNHDCTCARVNGYCVPDGPKLKCNEQNDTTTESLLIYHEHINTKLSLSPSTSCLAAYWQDNIASSPVERYEWSVSVFGHEPGFGIFDVINEKYLFDSDLRNYAKFCLSQNTSLLQGEKYIFHVRVWHSFDEYTHYTSEGVTVDGTAPSIGMGRHVKDHDVYMTDEVDFRSDLDGLYASWKNVFSDAESGIHHYEVLFGTSQGGNEIYGPEDVGMATNISLPTVTLQEGFHYYTTIYAYNNLGMVTFDYSDGFVVDLEVPYAGTCYNGLGFKNQKFSSGTAVSFSWNGFTDRHSYIHNYLYAIQDINEPSNKTLPFVSSYLQNQITLPGEFKHGHTYEFLVKAIDAAGHESMTITSPRIFIDSTPPVGFECGFVDTIEVHDVDCDCSPDKYHFAKPCICVLSENTTVAENELYRVNVVVDTDPSEMKMSLELGDQIAWVIFERYNNSYFAFEAEFLSSVEEVVEPIIYIDHEYRGSLMLSFEHCEFKEIERSSETFEKQVLRQVNKNSLQVQIPIYDTESGLMTTHVGLGSNKGGFQILPLTETDSEKSQIFSVKLEHNLEVHPVILVTNNAGIKSTFFFPPLLIDWTGPEIENVEVKATGQDYDVDVVVTWHAEDNESSLADCLWAIGKVSGQSDVLNWQQTETLNRATASGIDSLQHGDVVFVSIQCWNHINIKSAITTSEATKVMLKAPNTSEAVIVPNLDQVAIYNPHSDTQATRDIAAFSYYGFGDPSMIQHYEYKVHAEDDGPWVNAGKQDYILLESLNLMSENKLSVRAVNEEGFNSDPVEHVLYTNLRSPSLTGEPLVWYLNNKTISLFWGNVFNWDEEHGEMMYELYVGTNQGASDLVTGLVTKDSQITLVSKSFVPKGTCFVMVNAIAASGLYETYRELVYL